jgi:hypothetical protein
VSDSLKAKWLSASNVNFSLDGTAYLTMKDVGNGLNPVINFHGNDWLEYNRTQNSYNFYIGATNILTIDSSGVTVRASGGNIVQTSDRRLGKGDTLVTMSANSGGSGSGTATKTLEQIKSTYRFVLIHANTTIHDNSMLVHVDDLVADRTYELAKYTDRYVIVKTPPSGTGTAWTIPGLNGVNANVTVRGLY